MASMESVMLPARESTVQESGSNTSIGVRYLDLLGEFKPFGLIAEALEWDLDVNVGSSYNYFLFDPKASKDKEESEDDGVPNDQSDHEIFFRGNRIIWSTGSKVYKRFTTTSPIISICWCHLPDIDQALLCVLQVGILAIYNTSGEVVSIPLPRTVVSMWPLPFGLLLQNDIDENFPAHSSFFSSTLGACDISRSVRDFPHNSQNSSCSTWLSSHVILRDPLEHPQPVLVEDKGKLNVMKKFSERIIWASDMVPIMVSFNQGKMQHSVWVVEAATSIIEFESVGIPSGVVPKQFSCRRIWHAKCSQTASKVFLAIDDEMSPVLCFLFQEQEKLLLVSLCVVDVNDRTTCGFRPGMSWSIPAIAAAPVTVTRPQVKVGLLPFVDIIVVNSDNQLLLYSGKQCLCRYYLPPSHGKGQNLQSSESSNAACNLQDVKIVGLDSAVAGRVNIILDNGRMIRSALRRDPLCLLTNDCICAMAETVRYRFYIQFLVQFWGNVDTASHVRSDWELFSDLVLRMCGKHIPPSRKLIELGSSWKFLINSNFHKKYSVNFLNGISNDVAPDGWAEKCSTSLMKGVSDIDSSSLCSEFLVEIFYSLHAIYESLKLDCLRRRDLSLLVVLLADVAYSLDERRYLDYYIRDFPIVSKNFLGCPLLHGEKAPSDIFGWLRKCLQCGCAAAKISDLPCLIINNGNSVANLARKVASFYSILAGVELVGQKLSNGISCIIASGSFCTSEELLVLAMVGECFGLRELDLLPAGVSLPLRHALAKCREAPPRDWCPAAYVLLGREDLALSSLAHSTGLTESEHKANLNLISFATPYMLHLHPVTIPSAISDPSGLENKRSGNMDSSEGFILDGMEHIFNSRVQLRYGRDLRIFEVRRVLCSARPVVIQTSANPSSSDQDLQQAQLWQLTQRTAALPFGRGAFSLATMFTLLTEALKIPKLVFAGRLPSQQNATVNLDSNIRNVEALKFWPEFHNAVAAGLRIAPLQGKVSRTWIMYNKPKEHNVIHAGLLFALGLHGHLRVLTVIDVYTYLSEVHERMAVGLLLGLGASYRGTMNPSIMKSFFFHIPSRHPSSFPELDVPILVQSAALVSYGLLFEGSLHQPTVQMFLAEFTRKTGGDDVLEMEGYVLSAGFALGLVALGRGDGAFGLADSLGEQLLPYVAGKGPRHESSSVSVTSTGERTRGAGQILHANLNVSVTSPGAIMAIGLVFLKTESKQMMSKLSIPSTCYEMQFVRPDFIMLLVIARNLIMWSRVDPSHKWVYSEIPDIVRDGILALENGTSDADQGTLEVFFQAYVSIVTGACISIGLRFSGTKDANAQELLYDYAVYLLNEIKTVTYMSPNNFPKGLSQHVDRGMLENCLHLIVLSLSVVMAGSGHLKTFRLLRYLRNRNSVDGNVNFGIQMAISLAIGFLFLGGGLQSFSTSNSSIAALLMSIYPRLPSDPNDNRSHLQAFRHLYVLASEARWIQTVDVDTDLPVYVPFEITVGESDRYAETSYCEVTPCILPERSILKSVRVCGPRYWPQMIEVDREGKPWWMPGDKGNPFNSGILYVKRKVGSCSYIDDPVGCQSLLSRAMHKVFGLTNLGGSLSGLASVTIDELVSTFSSNPSLIAFAQLCSDPSLCEISDNDFQEFCFQVLFECVSRDRPALVQVYLSLYMSIWSMGQHFTSQTIILEDSFHIPDLKIALAYIEALLAGRLATSDGGIVQSSFIGSLRKKIDELLHKCVEIKGDLSNYLNYGCWPPVDRRSLLLSWYLQWYDVPQPSLLKMAKDRIKPKLGRASGVPLLRLLFPETHITAINDIDVMQFSS